MWEGKHRLRDKYVCYVCLHCLGYCMQEFGVKHVLLRERKKGIEISQFLSFLPSKNYSELENELPMNKLRPYISELFMK